MLSFQTSLRDISPENPPTSTISESLNYQNDCKGIVSQDLMDFCGF
jgi:hypothetical protein